MYGTHTCSYGGLRGEHTLLPNFFGSSVYRLRQLCANSQLLGIFQNKRTQNVAEFMLYSQKSFSKQYFQKMFNFNLLLKENRFFQITLLCYYLARVLCKIQPICLSKTSTIILYNRLSFES